MTIDIAALPSIGDLKGGPAPQKDENMQDGLGLMHAPDPVGYFILVALPMMNDRIGNVYIPDATGERERAASVVGRVMAMGPDCYRDEKRFPSGPWCKVGDTVLFSRYAGKRFTIEGTEFRMLADDEITATIPDGAKVGGL